MSACQPSNIIVSLALDLRLYSYIDDFDILIALHFFSLVVLALPYFLIRQTQFSHSHQSHFLHVSINNTEGVHFFLLNNIFRMFPFPHMPADSDYPILSAYPITETPTTARYCFQNYLQTPPTTPTPKSLRRDSAISATMAHTTTLPQLRPSNVTIFSSRTTTRYTPTHPASPTISTGTVSSFMKMSPRTPLQRIPHALAVDYPPINNIITMARYSMMATWWKLLDEQVATMLHTMITDAQHLRLAIENQKAYLGDNALDAGEYYRRCAEALRKIMMNMCWHVELSRNQRKIAKILEWVRKKEEDLIPLLEAFITQRGDPGASLETFTHHGYTPFHASRLRFLASFERVYSSDQLSPPSKRAFKSSDKWFTRYDTLQTSYQSTQSGEQDSHSFFTYTLLDSKWKHHHPVRGYNWHIPLAAQTPELVYAQGMMVAHGISLLSHIDAYGCERPIHIAHPAIRVIEKTLDLCIKAIERYWKLVKELPREDKFEPEDDGREHEMALQRAYVRQNMGVCLLVWRDMERARGVLGVPGAGPTPSLVEKHAETKIVGSTRILEGKRYDHASSLPGARLINGLSAERRRDSAMDAQEVECGANLSMLHAPRTPLDIEDIIMEDFL